MYFEKALNRHMADFYGDGLASRIPEPIKPFYVVKVKTNLKEKQVMTNEQMNNLTKQELNVALTPFMGGMTKQNLKTTKKEELVKMLEGYLAAQVEANVKSPKRKGPGKSSAFKANKHTVDLLMEHSMVGISLDDIIASIIEHDPSKDTSNLKNYVRTVLKYVEKGKDPYAQEKKIVTVEFDKETGLYTPVF